MFLVRVQRWCVYGESVGRWCACGESVGRWCACGEGVGCCVSGEGAGVVCLW